MRNQMGSILWRILVQSTAGKGRPDGERNRLSLTESQLTEDLSWGRDPLALLRHLEFVPREEMVVS